MRWIIPLLVLLTVLETVSLQGFVTRGLHPELVLVVVIGWAMLSLPEPLRVPRVDASPEVRRFLALMLPGLIASAIPQFKLVAGTMIASSSEAGVSRLYYAARLYERPLGAVAAAISSGVA